MRSNLVGLVGPGAAMLVWVAAFAASAEPPRDAGRTAPIEIGIVEGLQVFGDEASVKGVRVNVISGANYDVVGADLAGLANRARGDQTGFQFGFYNEVEGRFVGCQLGIFSSDADISAKGAQISTIANRVGDGSGGQIAILHNQADQFRGVQMTLGVNWATDLKGLQIGLINVNENGLIPVFPLVNFGF